jgi:hypothetical protein
MKTPEEARKFVLQALRNNGYYQEQEISRSEMRAVQFEGKTSQGSSIYSYIFDNEDGTQERGRVYIHQDGGKFYAEF